MRAPVADRGRVRGRPVGPRRAVPRGRVRPVRRPVAAGERAQSAQAGDILRSDFAGRARPTALSVVLPTAPAPAPTRRTRPGCRRCPRSARVEAAGGHLRRRHLVRSGPDATPAASPRPDGAGSWVSVVPTVDPFSDGRRKQLVADVRGTPRPRGDVRRRAGGRGSSTPRRSIADRLPWALGSSSPSRRSSCCSSSPGSVVSPDQGRSCSTRCSLTATFGAMVWIFQDGHLSGLLGLHAAPECSTRRCPILMFCIAFGLSMDYEVFLLSRIKEEYDRTGDNTRAVAARPAAHRPPHHRGRAPALASCSSRSAPRGVTIDQAARHRHRARHPHGRHRWSAASSSPRSCGSPVTGTGGRRRRCGACTQRFGLGEGPDLLRRSRRPDPAAVVSA